MMKQLPLLLVLSCAPGPAGPAVGSLQSRGAHTAERVTIVRDDHGIAHVHGRTDADAVFGMIYAQAEDDFPRIEANYLVALGRLAEAEGEAALWQDIRARLYVDPDALRALYAASPPYRTPAGLATRQLTVYRTHHGPIVRSADGAWIAVRLMQRPIEALSQSYLRTKATGLAGFRSAMALAANSSNNTIYADADGHIAYFHPQFVPRRDDRFDWTRPVDGSDPATEWSGVHGIDDSPHVIDPPGGWVMNTNDWPYSAAGRDSPRRERFPRYMDSHGENPRGRHAIRVLDGQTGFTLERLRDAAFDSYLPAFAELIPLLVAAWDAAPAGDPRRARLAAPIAVLRGWDFRWSADSVATALAVSWGQDLWQRLARGGPPVADALARTTPAEQLDALAAAVDRLAADFGSWRTPWGAINRFQRLTGDIAPRFDDAAPSVAVPFTSGQWGSLASFGARTYPGTRRMYGTSGNSFVAVVEFGPRVRALAVTAGGESGHPDSPHFTDQAERYARGDLREVYFYPDQLAGHTERTYHPGR